MKRHDGPQVLALPVEDPQFRRLAHLPRIGEHVQLPRPLVHGQIPDDARTLRIARQQEPLQLQPHLARRAGMRGTGAQRDRLLVAARPETIACASDGGRYVVTPHCARRRKRVGLRCRIVGCRETVAGRDARQGSPVAGLVERAVPTMDFLSRNAGTVGR